MPVSKINNPKELNTFLQGSPLSVVKIYANWCGPCKVYGPKYEQLAERHNSDPSVNFAETDVDKKIIKVSSLPTTIFVKNGRIIDKVVGGNVGQIEEVIRKHK